MTSGGPPARLHRVEQIMGMPIVLDVYDADVSQSALEQAFDWLRWVDATFSTYRADSEISRLNRGELRLEDCSRTVREVLSHCDALRAVTNGYFDHHAAASWNGGHFPPPNQGGAAAVDPSGLVKGWSIDGVARILERAGANNYCADAAGDMRLKGCPTGASNWQVGIRHPFEPDSVAAVVAIRDGVIATSAAYERGDHVINPHTGGPPQGVSSVTIVGPGDLATADAYATTVFAMGTNGTAWAAQHIRPYEAFVICTDRTTVSTPGFSAWRAS